MLFAFRLTSVIAAIFATWRVWETMLAASLSGSETSAALIAIPVSSYLIWKRWDDIQFTHTGNLYGVAILGVGTMLMLVGVSEHIRLLAQVGAVSICFGVVSSMLSHRSILRLLPAAFTLLFVVEIPGLFSRYVSLPLAKFNASLAAWFMELFGFPAELQGTLVTAGGVQLQVVDACDGLRFFWSVLLITFAVGIVQRVTLKTFILLLMTTPVFALALNTLRIVGVAIAFQAFPNTIAEQVHDVSGWAMMAGAWAIPVILMQWFPIVRKDVPERQDDAEITRHQRATESISPAAWMTLVIPLATVLTINLTRETERPRIPIAWFDATLQEVPYRLEQYVGEDVAVPKRQLAVLRPDAILSRRYTSLEDASDFLLIVSFHQNGEAHSGHSVQNCYGALGWEAEELDATSSEARWTRLGLKCFQLFQSRSESPRREFSRELIDERMYVYELAVGGNRRGSFRNARTAQTHRPELMRVQLVFRPTIAADQRDRLTRIALTELGGPLALVGTNAPVSSEPTHTETFIDGVSQVATETLQTDTSSVRSGTEFDGTALALPDGHLPASATTLDSAMSSSQSPSNFQSSAANSAWRSKRTVLIGLMGVVLLGSVAWVGGGNSFSVTSAGIPASKIRQLRKPNVIDHLQQLERHLEQSPDDLAAWSEYADLRISVPSLKGQHLSQAIHAREQCVRLASASSDDWLKLAHDCRTAGQYGPALRSAKRAMRLSPFDERIVAELASIQMETGDNEQAVRLLGEALNRCESSWRLVLLRTRAQIERAEKSEVIMDDIRQAQSRRPNESELRGVSAYASWATGDADGARRELEAIATDPKESSLEYLRFLASLARSMGQSEVINEILQSSTEAQRDPFLSLLSARQHWELGNAQAVIDVLQARQLSLATDSEACLLLSMALRAIGEKEQLDLLRDEFRQQRGYPTTDRWQRLIELLVSDEDPSPQSIGEAAGEVLELCPGSPLVRYIHASAYFLAGEYDVAMRVAGGIERTSPRWELPQHLQFNSAILTGDPHRALEIARRMVTAFPERFDAVSGYAIAQSLLLPMADASHAERLLRWTSTVQLSENDPRIEEVALVRWLAHARLGDDEQAARMLDQNLANWRELPRQDLIRLVTVRRQRRLASGSLDADPAVETMDASVIDPTLSKRIDGSRELTTERIDGSVRWRIAKARELLTAKGSARNDASAALVLRPVIRAIPDHSDARMLMGVAMLRLRDHSAAIDHFLRAVANDPPCLSQTLRLSLGFRRGGDWPDARQLVDFWVSASRTAGESSSRQRQRVTGDGKTEGSDTEQTIHRLQVLAECAERSDDPPLAIATYRKLLRLDADNAVACNNLAFLIYRKPDSLEEALELASRAVEQSPGCGDFQHTMRSIQEHVARLRERSSNTEISKPPILEETK